MVDSAQVRKGVLQAKDSNDGYIALVMAQVLIIGWISWVQMGEAVGITVGISLVIIMFVASRWEITAGIASVILGAIWGYLISYVVPGWWAIGIGCFIACGNVIGLRTLNDLGDWKW